MTLTLNARLAAGTFVPAGARLSLMHGFGGSCRHREEIALDEPFTVPETVNEFWYRLDDLPVRQFVNVPNGDETESYPIDTDEQVAEARAALRASGIESAPVHHGDPNDPDSYRDSVQVLRAEDATSEHDRPNKPGGPMIHDFGLPRR